MIKNATYIWSDRPCFVVDQEGRHIWRAEVMLKWSARRIADRFPEAHSANTGQSPSRQ